jgi:hypothetical protein
MRKQGGSTRRAFEGGASRGPPFYSRLLANGRAFSFKTVLVSSTAEVHCRRKGCTVEKVCCRMNKRSVLPRATRTRRLTVLPSSVLCLLGNRERPQFLPTRVPPQDLSFRADRERTYRLPTTSSPCSSKRPQALRFRARPLWHPCCLLFLRRLPQFSCESETEVQLIPTFHIKNLLVARLMPGSLELGERE